MTNEYMSSEESADDDTLTLHPIPWRSNYVNAMFKKIDVFCVSKKPPQAKRPMKPRQVGSPSNRPIPDAACSQGCTAVVCPELITFEFRPCRLLLTPIHFLFTQSMLLLLI
jgi:hypothetical protein